MLLDLTRFMVPGCDWLPPLVLRRHGQRYVLAALTRDSYFEARPHLLYCGAVYVQARRKQFRQGPQGVPRYESGQPGDPTPEEFARSEGYGSDGSESSWSEAPIGVGDGAGAGGAGGAGAGGGGAGSGG